MHFIFKTTHEVTIVAIINIITINNMRFGPAGFCGTVALCNVVNAGVFSCSLTFIASN